MPPKNSKTRKERKESKVEQDVEEDADVDKLAADIGTLIRKFIKKHDKNSKRRKKRNTDPDRPKQPKSSFFMYKESVEKEIKKQNPKMGVTQVAAKAGQQWREELSEDQKNKWKKKHEKERAVYEAALETYHKKRGKKSESKN